MSKLYQTFQSLYSLHKPPQTILFHTTFLSERRNSSLTKTTDSCFFLLKKYLVLVNLSNTTLSLSHSIVYVFCWQRKQRSRNKLLPSMKTFLLLLTKSSNARNFCFFLCFMSFFRFFCFFFLFPFSGLLKPLPQTYKVLLTQTSQNVLTKPP